MSSRPIVALVICSSITIAGSCLAVPPEIPPGTCTYLVGAPPGALAAATEQRFGDIFQQPVSSASVTLDVWGFSTSARPATAMALGTTRSRCAIAQASATGDTNVNARLARIRILMANAQINAHQYQRACKSISDALRALTTP